MEPKDFSNAFNSAQKEIRYAYRGLNRKRQIIDLTLDELHEMQMAMIENAVTIKESHNFPEANFVINHVKAL
jgi:hypothetical protein